MPSTRYLRELARTGRVPIMKVEVDADICGLLYATGPCGVDVALGGTGDLGDDKRCYYTYPTCQARATYTRTATLTLNKLFTFAGDAEGLTDQGDDAVIVFSHEPADGNPSGSVEFASVVHATIDRSERARKTTLVDTWESMFGVERGSTITKVELVDFDRKVTKWASAPLFPPTAAKIRLVQSDGSSVTADDNADLISHEVPQFVDGSWVTVTGPGTRNVDTDSQGSQTVIGLEIEYSHGSNAAPAGEDLEVRIDEITLRVTYTAPGTKTFVFVTGPDAPRKVKQVLAVPGPMPVLVDVSPVSAEVKTKEGFIRTDKAKIKLQDVVNAPLRKPASQTYDASLPMLTPLNPGFFQEKSLRNTSRRGSYFRRFLKIFSNIKGRNVRIYSGFFADDWEDTDYHEEWRGTVKDIEFNGTDTLTIHAVDFLDDLEREFPPVLASSNKVSGTAHASLGITPEDTTLNMVDVAAITDPADLTYGHSVIRIKSELIKVLTVDTGTGNFTVTRGAFGTVARGYPPSQDFEEVYVAGNPVGAELGMHPFDIVRDLMQRAGIDTATLLDAATWTKQQGLTGPVYFEHLIDEPTQIREIIFDVLELIGGHLYIDGGTIKIDVSAPARTTDTLTRVVDPQIVGGTNKFRWNDPGRVTHVVTQFNKSGDKYLKTLAAINVDTSLEKWYGKKGFQTERLKAPWFRTYDWGAVQGRAIRRLNRRELPPVQLGFHADIRDRALQIAQKIEMEGTDLQDANGDPEVLVMRIIKRTVRLLRGKMEFLAELWSADEDQGDRRYGYIGTNGLGDYDAASSSDQDKYAWLADATPALGAADDAPYYMS